MQTMSARVSTTDQASRYLSRLCRHFSHKLPVAWDDAKGEIQFPFGTCRLEAVETDLLLRCEADDDESLGRLGQVIASHLERFASGAKSGADVQVVWQEAQKLIQPQESSMDDKIQAVLEVYENRARDEQKQPRTEPPGGRDGGNDMRMRAIGPETGRLLNILVKSLKAPRILELGTSFGYSGIWLGEAARATGGRLITMEMHEYKSEYARQMAQKAGLAEHIDYQVGDAVAMIEQLPHGLDFVFVDLWKDLYVPCLEAFYPKLNPGAIIVADNMVRPANTEVKAYGLAVRAKPGITSVMLPVGSGIEISRFEPV